MKARKTIATAVPNIPDPRDVKDVGVSVEGVAEGFSVKLSFFNNLKTASILFLPPINIDRAKFSAASCAAAAAPNIPEDSLG